VSGRRVAPRGGPGEESEARLVVNPVACEGIGMCAHLAAGLVALDSWGYPIVPRDLLTGRDLRAARNAASGCPRRALLLQGAR
jgi:ferredoxin